MKRKGINTQRVKPADSPKPTDGAISMCRSSALNILVQKIAASQRTTEALNAIKRNINWNKLAEEEESALWEWLINQK